MDGCRLEHGDDISRGERRHVAVAFFRQPFAPLFHATESYGLLDRRVRAGRSMRGKGSRILRPYPKPKRSLWQRKTTPAVRQHILTVGVVFLFPPCTLDKTAPAECPQGEGVSFLVGSAEPFRAVFI